MSLHKSFFGISVVVIVCALTPEGASAQDTRRDAGTLTLTANAAADTTNGVASALSESVYSDFQAAFRYSSAPERSWAWQAGASTVARETPTEFMFVGNAAGAGIGFALGGRTKVQVSESASFISQHSFIPNLSTTTGELGGFGQVPTSAVDYSQGRSPAVASATTINLTRMITARSSLTVAYGLSRVDYSDAVNPSLAFWTGSARYNYQISKDLAFHAGYGRRTARYSTFADNTPLHVDDYDLGLDYRRSFELLSRNTSLTFGTGSTFTADKSGARRLFVTGNADLVRRFGRTANAGVHYSRAVRLMEGFLRPVFSDAVSVSFDQRLMPRMNLSANATANLGNVGSTGERNQYRTYSGSAQLGFALSRRISMYAQYLYYQYDIGSEVERIAIGPDAQARSTARVGLTVTVPIIRERPRGRRQ